MSFKKESPRRFIPIDLSAYHPFGIPLLKLMGILITLSLSATLIYELIK